MDLLTLTDNELKIFLEEGLPLEAHRKIYINSPKLSQKIKGFRPNTIPLQKLVQTSMSLIKKEKNNILINVLTDYYNNYKELVKSSEDKMMSDGYPGKIAYSLAILKGYNKKFLPIFFKLEGIGEDEQKQIFENSKMVTLIENISAKKTEKILKDNSNDIEKNVIKSIEPLNKEIKLLKDEAKLIDSDITLIKANNSETKHRIENIEKNYISKDVLDSSLSVVANKNKNEVKDIISKVANSDSIIELQNEIQELKKTIKELKENLNTKNIIITNIQNKNYDEVDDYLYDNIGDVIENFVSGEVFDVFREYLVEIIYSNKPIICSSKNAGILANIVSSILTGGNYYTISVSNNTDDVELVKKIEQIPSLNGNKVIIIKNKIGVSDYGYLLDYIGSRPSTEKFIFEIGFAKELIFMAPDSLDKFHFFIYDLKDAKINYKYSYDFSNEKRKALTNSDYTKSLEAIGASLSNTEIMNVKFYGILAFSIIPFTAINLNIEPSELVNKLLDSSIRKKCGAIIND